MRGADFPIAFRLLDRSDMSDDMPYVLCTWRDSFHNTNGAGVVMRFAEYKPLMHAAIREVLERSTCLIACDPQAPSIIYGWIVAAPPTLHYVYVRPERRRHRVCGVLLDAIEEVTAQSFGPKGARLKFLSCKTRSRKWVGRNRQLKLATETWVPEQVRKASREEAKKATRPAA